MSAFYVYIFHDRGIPCYIGKGQANRFMQHLGRDDWPRMEDLTVSFRPHPTELSALQDESRLIRMFGIRTSGGLLLNKVVPSTSEQTTHNVAKKIVTGKIKSDSLALSIFIQDFMVSNRLPLFSRMSQIAAATGVSPELIKKLVTENPDIQRTETSRPKYHVEQVIRAIHKRKADNAESRRKSRFERLIQPTINIDDTNNDLSEMFP